MYFPTLVLIATFRFAVGDVLAGLDGKADHPTNVVVGGHTNQIIDDGTGSKFAAIMSGVENRVRQQGGVIVGGSYHDVKNGDGVVVGGQNNTVSGLQAFAGGCGYKQHASGNYSAVFSGQHGVANETFAIAIGSFANTSHASAIVLTARNTPDNTRLQSAKSIKPTFYCNSKGDNSVHICSGDGAGVFINDRNVVDELEALNLKANESAVELAAEKERVANLTDEVAALKESLQSLADSIMKECLNHSASSGRRLGAESDEPCYPPTSSPTISPTKFPTGSPIQRGHTTLVGKTLLQNNDVRSQTHGKLNWTDAEMRALFDHEIVDREGVCGVDNADLKANVALSPGKITDLRALFLCEPIPFNGLTTAELIAIISVVTGVVGIVCGGLICGNPTIQGRFAVAFGCTDPETTGTSRNSTSHDRNRVSGSDSSRVRLLAPTDSASTSSLPQNTVTSIAKT